MSKTIAQIFGLNPPQVYTTSKAVPLDNPDPSLLYGLELEIENTREDMEVKGLTVTTDGSLRNNGREFITQPMTYSNLYHVLHTFFAKNKLGPDNYSERCSIHVHTNVLDLTNEQLQNLVMLYQVFESVLFNFIGNNREKNIFCVPWKETNLSYRLLLTLQEEAFYRVGDWQKYTALNLLPIQIQGSVEWRHMEGNCDLKRIMQWCRMIGHLYRMSRGNTQKQIQDLVMRLNTTSLYNDVLGTVFQEDADALRRGNFIERLEDGVLNMKYSLLQPVKLKSTTKPSIYDRLLVEQAAMLMRHQVPPAADARIDWGAVNAEARRNRTLDDWAQEFDATTANAPAPVRRTRAIPAVQPAEQPNIIAIDEGDQF